MSFSVGRLTLQAYRLAMDVISHNVANANTPGYSAQRAVFTSNPSSQVGATLNGKNMYLGGGVSVETITSSRDLFLGLQIRNELGLSGRSSVRADGLDRIQAVLGEPTNGLSGPLSTFFASLSAAANNPADSATRSRLLADAQSLADRFHTYDVALRAEVRSIDDQVQGKVSEVNGWLDALGDVNDKIIRSGGQPPELLDQRDGLLDKIAQATGLKAFITANGTATVTVEGKPLVLQDRVSHLGTVVVGGVTQVTYQPDGSNVTLPGGELAGYIQLRDMDIPALRVELDAVAAALVSEVNAVHQRGFGLDDAPSTTLVAGTPSSIASATPTPTAQLGAGSWAITSDGAGGLSAVFTPLGGVAQPAVNGTITAGGSNTTLIPGVTLVAQPVLQVSTDTMVVTAPNRNFFAPAGTTASNIAIDAAVLNQPRNIALARDSRSPGDGRIGQELAALVNKLAMGAGTQTISGAYRASVARLAVETATAERTNATQTAMTSQLEQRRAQVQGVSLDEEAALLIEYQRVYQAAARMIAIEDEMMQSLLDVLR